MPFQQAIPCVSPVQDLAIKTYGNQFLQLALTNSHATASILTVAGPIHPALFVSKNKACKPSGQQPTSLKPHATSKKRKEERR
jgi:hypothetical protein